MIDPIRRLLTEAGNAKQTRAFWQAVTGILSDWVGGARVHLVYKGLNESGTVQAGATAKGRERFIADYHDAEGRHVQATFQGLPDGFPSEALRSAVEIATHLAVMVARRAGLERERRLGTFLVELSRWLLAAPERELLLRYTLQSVMSLVEAQGAFVALRQREGDTLRIAATVGQCAELQGRELGLTTSTTGAVVRSGGPLPLALVDRQGRVQQLNQAGCRLFGIATESQALGIHLEALGLSPSEISLHLVLARPQAGEPWHGRVLVTQPAGDRRICDCTITGLSGVGRDNLLVALYDRTDELRAQRELIAREKLATVGEIASGVAHEVNNPLAAIRMEAELLGRSSKDPDTNTTAMTITREVDRAARIVRSLLRLARRADTTPTRVQINDLVHDVAEIRQRVLRADNVEFRTRLDQSRPAVLGLGQELQQVVINLVTNAEYVVKGREPAVIQLTTQAREGWVRLTVEDSGPGIPPEIRGRIFDPFFTTKGPDEGTGLGLAICQRVVTEVGGKIWLEDSELGGAKFVVELPAAPENVEATAIG